MEENNLITEETEKQLRKRSKQIELGIPRSLELFNKPAIEGHEVNGGVGYLYAFPNFYGASVVKHYWSYGGQYELWELAVIRWLSKKDWELCYHTPVTSDVIGYLTPEEVTEILDKIEQLPPEICPQEITKLM